ncbi:MAG: hypothetical protein K2N46_06165 [Lachnospiraceae bacterium]|nr:hypothetical protein [Lachnospiraceae bacterium]
MTYAEYQEYMRNFFEQYYQKLSQDEIRVTLPLEEEEKEMWSDDADPDEEWKKWKLVPARIPDEEIEELEKEIGVRLPLSLKAFLTVTHHCFYDPIGYNSAAEHFQGVRHAWNPVLVRCGYLPFTWDEEGYFIRCIRLEKMPEEEKCGIYQIDHEVLFDFDEDTVTSEEIDQCMELISENLLTYLDEILHDRDCDSLRKASKKAVLKVLKEECGLQNYDELSDKMETEEEFDKIIAALKPVQEQYSISDDDLEEILSGMEYSVDW